MAIKGVLFDKDGTLVDSDGTWVPTYRALLSEVFPEEAESKLVEAGYDPVGGRFLAGSVLAGGTTRELVEVWWPEADHASIASKVRLIDVEYRDLALAHLTPLLPLAPVLAALKVLGLRLGVATNDTEDSARRHMAALGVAELFDAIIGADSVANPKPAGDMIARFAEITGLAPAEIAMVGDNPHDIETARNGGAGLAIAVLSGNATRGDIAHLADHVVASIADLPAYFAGL